MKFSPILITLSCALFLAGCGKQVATTSDADKAEQERLAAEQQGQILSAMHEREAALDERERLLNERSQQLTVAAPPSQQPAQPAPPPAAPAQPAPPSPDATYQEFYDALSAYGSWVQMPGYDYVWQPAATVQDFRWRPYTLGHWVFTDNGWTWVSDEPFGWITYHYGRWMRTQQLGWVWVPGDEWAPAWVSWRSGGDFVGWAPLPPEARFDGATGIKQWADEQYNLGASDYTFVPATDFGDGSMADVEAPPDQSQAIYDDSDNQTDIYYDTATYAIVCYGPNYEFLRSKARRALTPPLRLSRDGFRAGGKNGAVVAGNTLQVTAPRIIRPRTPVAPKTVHGTVADTRIISPTTPPGPNGAAPGRPLHPQTFDGQPVASGQLPYPVKPAFVPEPRGNAPNEQQQGATGAASNADAQQARDLALIEQQQNEREHQIEAAQAAEQAQRAEALRSEEAARAEHAAAEAQAGKLAREQAASQVQAARIEAAQAEAARAQAVQAAQGLRGAPPAVVPAGTLQGTQQGRTQ
jgi:hypothetical protein